MVRPLFRTAAILCALALALAVSLPARAEGGNPGPTNAGADTVDITTIRVFWDDDPLAESYRIYRSGPGWIAEVPEDVNEYLDTGLTPGVQYFYGVASVVGGETYWMNEPDFGAMPMENPEAITHLSLQKVPNGMGGHRLQIDLAWTPVSLVTEYWVEFRIGDSGYYAYALGTPENTASLLFDLPAGETTFWFRVLARYEEPHDPGDEEYMFGYSAYTPEASVTYHPFDISQLLRLFRYVRVWPWDDPFHEDWLKRVLETYADPGLWPADTAPDTALLAGLAEKLSRGEALTENEQGIAGAIHPHGLALLTGAWLAPPDEAQALALTVRLSSLAGLLGGEHPEGLGGAALERYRTELSLACELVSLGLEDAPDGGSGQVHVRFIRTLDGTDLQPSLQDQDLTRVKVTPTPRIQPVLPLHTIVPIQPGLPLIPVRTPSPTR